MLTFSGAHRRWLMFVATITVVAGCGTDDAALSAPAPSSSGTPSSIAALPPQPWTLADLTYHPCSVLDADDIAHLVLEPSGTAATPPQELPRCSWFSVRTAPAGSFDLAFSPHRGDLTDPGRRQRSAAPEELITIGNRRAVLNREIRPDGRNGSCDIYVSVASGGSFYLGTAVPGTATGVDWNVCAKTTEVAATILARLR
jgi:hypothetical protein